MERGENKPKFGDVREDGRVFIGYLQSGKYQHWISHEAFLKRKQRIKKWSSSDEQKAKRKAWTEENREKSNAIKKTWRERNPDYAEEYKLRPGVNERLNKMSVERNSSPEVRAFLAQRKRISKIVRNKTANTKELIGCSRIFFIKYIEGQFYGDITWDNYGSHWHIDHIKQCNTFNLENEEEIKECFNFRNLRPLLAVDNLKRPKK